MSEFKKCQSNGVTEIIEVQIGYDGIVVANSVNATPMNLSRKDIFLALAAKVPGAEEGKLIENPYTSWTQVNASLPDTEIEDIGPTPTCVICSWAATHFWDKRCFRRAGDGRWMQKD